MNEKEFNPDTDKIQQVFKGLKISSQIGSGGQKIVFKAEHPNYGEVALKLIRPCGPEAKDRILREITLSKNLIGREFSIIHNFGEIMIDCDKILYVFEEYLEGQNPERYYKKTKNCPYYVP